MSFAKTWSGDWRGRVLARVHQRGFATVTQYAEAHPGVSLFLLARELGPDDVAAAQIRAIFVEEAVKLGAVSRVLRDLLVRELRYLLPRGWTQPLDDEARSRVAGVIAYWRTELEVEGLLECFDEESMLNNGQDLLSAELPAGWLPAGPDDPVIITFVNRCLGRLPS